MFELLMFLSSLPDVQRAQQEWYYGVRIHDVIDEICAGSPLEKGPYEKKPEEARHRKIDIMDDLL
jgi:hypothetical protein